MGFGLYFSLSPLEKKLWKYFLISSMNAGPYVDSNDLGKRINWRSNNSFSVINPASSEYSSSLFFLAKLFNDTEIELGVLLTERTFLFPNSRSGTL